MVHFPVLKLLNAGPNRDPNPQAARLAHQFIAQNAGLLRNLGITIEPRYDGTTVELLIRTSTYIGAIPLLSPTTGKPEYGLVVKPRFAWSGLGPMLGAMGWRVIPTPLALPLLPRSERKIPAWVLSSVVLIRLRALLERLDRRFEIVTEERQAPRGRVDWSAYATRHLSRGKFLNVPCSFPDLRDDRDLLAAIAFTLRKQIQSLESQRMAGVFVLQLLAVGQMLLKQVQHVLPKPPPPTCLQAWFRGSLQTVAFREGLQAIEWTVDDRGLAGLSDLEGLPWVMPMEAFFEAWIEHVLQGVARKIGGTVRTGRLRQTLAPLHWEPSYLGSQKYLLPDLILERGDTTIIVDAKYKEHWEEISAQRWSNLEEEVRELHRADLLQVLAYANLAGTERVTVCLVYPCRPETWDSLKARNRLLHQASLSAGFRSVRVILTAVPVIARTQPIIEMLSRVLQGTAQSFSVAAVDVVE